MTEQYNFNELVDRGGTHSIKWDYLPDNAPTDALPLWVADMDFPCALPIQKALHERVDRQIYGYTRYDNAETKEAICGWYSRRFGWEIDADSVFYATCVVTAFSVLIHVLTQPGDGIVIQSPVYHPFGIKIRANERKVVDNPLCCKDGTYSMDLVDLEHKLALPDVKGLLLCSPHNPVGRVWSEGELRAVVAIAQKYDKWIISDEIHCDILRAGVIHHPLLKICPEYAHRIISCTSPSKTFNLAGLQLCNIIIPNPEYRRLWLGLANERLAISDAGVFGLTAMVAAFREGDEWLSQVNHYIDENITFAEEFFRTHMPHAKVAQAQGTYLLWVDFGAYAVDDKRLENILTQECKVALNQGYLFGEQGSGFVRINVACPRYLLEQALTRIADVLER